ncbi:MAG: U32 family peptidase [Oscillospiraceae bacterium]|jgi:collagenase-like PrtC family protease|nr:U32 family peptidase [Oscillospiraceae bacterium]
MKNKVIPELLAPAGSAAMLLAALRCGADAVYLGGSAFNARTGARNFSPDQLREAIALCKNKGVRLYLTLNTMLTDRELPQAIALAQTAIDFGADALIVQDLGLMRRLHERFPNTPLHASTQCSVQTAAGMALLCGLGVVRAVVPRECTREEIAALLDHAPVDLEVFVYGAHCMAVSGQCLLSAALGDRSGNKGSCAQPCRLPWRVNGAFASSYALSLKDLSLIDYVTEPPLDRIASFKIEGRRKRPEYAAAAVTAFRHALDGKPPTVTKDELRQAFSRDGFTQGYFLNKRDSDMFGRRDTKDTMPPALLQKLRNMEYSRDRRQNIAAQPVQIDTIAQTKTQISALASSEKEIWLRFLSHEQIPRIAFEKNQKIFLPCDTPQKNIARWKADVEIPAGIFGGGAAVLSQLRRAKEAGARRAMAHTLDGIALARESGLIPVGGEGLQVCNSESLCALRDFGAERAVVSPECTASQLRDMRRVIPAGAVIYGRMALMLMRVCPVRAAIGCKACGGNGAVIDRKGVRFPVRCKCACAVMYNSRPIWLADKKLPEMDIRLFSFTTESRAQCAAVLRDYADCKPCAGEFTRGKL